MGEFDDSCKLLTVQLPDDWIGKPVDTLTSHCWESNLPSGNTGLGSRCGSAHRGPDRGDRLNAHFVERQSPRGAVESEHGLGRFIEAAPQRVHSRAGVQAALWTQHVLDNAASVD